MTMNIGWLTRFGWLPDIFSAIYSLLLHLHSKHFNVSTASVDFSVVDRGDNFVAEKYSDNKEGMN